MRTIVDSGRRDSRTQGDAGFGVRFPLLEQPVHEPRLVYLDSAATTQKPAEVIAAVRRFYETANANPHRGLYRLSMEATEIYEGCRRRIAQWIGAENPEAIVLAHSATNALNLVAHGIGHRLRAGDEVVVTEMEHHANLVPWIMLAKRRGLTLRVIPVTGEGELDLAGLSSRLNHRTRIVSFTHVSNVLGTINPVEEIVARAKRVGAWVILDAAQSVGHLPVSVSELGIDALIFSGHKCYGPMGIGVLAGAREFLEALEPMESGGEMIEEVFLDRATWAPLPQRLEAGTRNAAAAAGLQAAIDVLDRIGLDRIRRHEVGLAEDLLGQLSGLGGVEVLGPASASARGGLVSMHLPAIHPHDLATLLDERGVAVRAGHHCAQPLHRALGLIASTRASFALHTTHADIDVLVSALDSARKFLQPVRRRRGGAT